MILLLISKEPWIWRTACHANRSEAKWSHTLKTCFLLYPSPYACSVIQQLQLSSLFLSVSWQIFAVLRLKDLWRRQHSSQIQLRQQISRSVPRLTQNILHPIRIKLGIPFTLNPLALIIQNRALEMDVLCGTLVVIREELGKTTHTLLQKQLF